jgi:hypothetical protein
MPNRVLIIGGGVAAMRCAQAIAIAASPGDPRV